VRVQVAAAGNENAVLSATPGPAELAEEWLRYQRYLQELIDRLAPLMQTEPPVTGFKHWVSKASLNLVRAKADAASVALYFQDAPVRERFQKRATSKRRLVGPRKPSSKPVPPKPRKSGPRESPQRQTYQRVARYHEPAADRLELIARAARKVHQD
jgi:hypothetical protein